MAFSILKVPISHKTEMLRMRPTINIHFILQTLLLLSIAACATPEHRSLKVEDLKEGKAHHLVQNIYPESLSLSQHILLSIKGKEYDFPAYLAIDQNKGYRALAFTDMGGKVFDFLSIMGENKIISKPKMMPEIPILKGVMEDIELLFMPYSVGSYYKENRTNPDNVNIKTTFSGDDRLSSYEIEKNNKLFSKIILSNYRLFPEWKKALPAEIKIINYRWDYVIEIKLLKINMAAINKKVLSMELLSND